MLNLWSSGGDSIGTQAAHRGSVHYLSELNYNLLYKPSTLGAPIIMSTGADNMVRLWDLRRFKCISDFFGGESCGTIKRAEWTGSEGQSIVTASNNGSLKLWDYQTPITKDKDDIVIDGNISIIAKDGGANDDNLEGQKESKILSPEWVASDLPSHSQACTDLVTGKNFVASSSKSGQIYLWN
jgi:WD40 repeat protein